MFKPQYIINHQILNNLLQSAEVRSMVLNTSILPQQEAKLRRQALIRMIHSSTSIEGNILNRYQVVKILDGKKVYAPERDIQDVKNYQAAIYYVYHMLNKKQKITSQTILELHVLISKNTLPKEK